MYEPLGQSSAPSDAACDGVTLIALFHLAGADLELFEDYEAAVLPLLARHGGVLERRIRSVDRALELHLLHFRERAGLREYRADGTRLEHADLLARSRVRVEVVEGD